MAYSVAAEGPAGQRSLKDLDTVVTATFARLILRRKPIHVLFLPSPKTRSMGKSCMARFRASSVFAEAEIRSIPSSIIRVLNGVVASRIEFAAQGTGLPLRARTPPTTR
jgi:hypothetical protein